MNHYLTFSCISFADVMERLDKLSVAKGPGPDGIHPRFIKNCALSLCEPLLIIYNKSLSEGVFPTLWKVAYISPIHKSGPAGDVSNYRPISKLSIFGKIFESIVNDHINISMRSYIIPQQHGFCRGRSTITNLLSYSEFLFSALDSSGQVDVVFTDFRKAFDKVNHWLLLQKLKFIGFPDSLLRWIDSYIHFRTQIVVVCGCRSNSVDITSGVPQGSHLGPTLFNLFINDINETFLSSHFQLYADDLKIYQIIRSELDCHALQDDLSRFFEYCSRNCLYLNLEKCKYMRFTRKKSPSTFIYSIDNINLKEVTEFNDLGVTFDSKLSFANHIETVTARAFQMFGFVSRITKPFADPGVILHLYKTLILPILEYACIIWDPRYGVGINRIERVQRKFLNFLNFRSGQEKCAYDINLNRYDLLSLEHRRQLFTSLYVFKIVNGQVDCPHVLHCLNFYLPRLESRVPTLFYADTQNTNLGQNAPIYRMMSVCNEFASDIDLFFHNIHQFKRLLISRFYAQRT